MWQGALGRVDMTGAQYEWARDIVRKAQNVATSAVGYSPSGFLGQCLWCGRQFMSDRDMCVRVDGAKVCERCARSNGVKGDAS